MKTFTARRTLAIPLVAVLLAAATSAYAVSLEVTTTVNSPSSPINICTDPASITTTIKNNSGGTAPAGSVTQTLPVGCTILITSPSCPGLTVSQNNNVITYTFAAMIDQYSCSVAADLIIPCSVTTVANAALNIVYGSADYTFASDPTTTFQISRSIMNIVNFFDDAVIPVAISPNAPQKLLISENRHRRFDFLVSDGVVGGLAFTYRYESEIAPKGFVLEGVLPNGTANGLPTTLTLNLPAPVSNPATYVISGNNIASLFPDQATTMSFGRSIRVRELFDVIHCSPTPNNDGTDFSITWDCPSSTGLPCTTDTTRRTILVETSGGGLTPGYSMPGLDLCGITPSDMVVSFRNSSFDSGTGKIPGSAMKTLRLLDVPMNLDPFTVQGLPLGSTPNGAIFLEGSGTPNSVDVTALNALYPGFYVYDQALHRVRINLDVLTGQPLGPTGPLVNGFLPEQPTALFNELVESGILYLRFKQVTFNCHAAVFNASSPSLATFDFDDWPKPSGGYLFFGRDSNDRWRFYYDNMCQASPLPHPLPAAEAWEFGVLHNSFPVTGFAEADKTDVQLGDHAILDFYYQYQAGGVPSAFSFFGALSGNPYFTCVNTYQAVVTIPDLYDLNTATYYANPNGVSGLPISPLPVPTLKPGYKVYTFTGLSFNGRISVDVTLTSCPFGTGGFDLFSASVQAVCNGCTDCAYTVSSFTTELYHHCPGPCDGPPQGTANFSFNRSSFGWTDDTMATPVTPGPGISLNRAYNCDTIAVASDGSFDPNSPAAALTTALAFRIDYTPGVNFQFFEFVSGSLTYGSFPPYAINVAQDLSGSFKGTPVPVTGWPGSANGANGTCSLWITFPAAVLADLKSSGATVPLSLQLVLRVKPMTATPGAGYYNLPQVRAQYYTDVGNSCDPWGDNMMVLNVRTTSRFVIRAANDADQSLGWPFNTGVCERHFLFQIGVSGGLSALDDFPHEFRPIVQMPAANDLQLTLPAGVRFNSATFSVFNRPGWAFAYPINAIQSGSTVNLRTWVTNGVARDWPLLDKDGPPIDLMIRGSLINDCPATAADPIGPATLAFPFTSGVYSMDPACRNTRAVPDILMYPIAPVTSIALSSLVTPYHVTSTPTTITGIDFTYLGWSRSVIENTWVRVTSAGLTATALHRAGVAAPIVADANGYFRLGSIVALVANAAHLTLDVALNGCNPGVNIPVTIEYGYDCAGYPTAYPPSPGACVQQSYTFDVLPEASGMSMVVTPPAVTAGGPCQSYQYKVRLTSTQLADLEHPQLTISLPPGLSFTAPPPTFLRSDNAGTVSGNLTTVSQAGQDFTWNINHDVYADGGMPPTPAFVELTFTVTGTCASSAGDSKLIVFHPLGKNICGGDVTYPDDQETLHLSQQPVVTSCPPDAVLECPATPTFGTPTFFEACDPNLLVTFVDTSLPGTCPTVKRTWTATDHCGNSVTCSQTVTVVDITPPVITGCTNISTNSLAGTNGNFVTYSVSSVDNCDGVLPVNCVPASGSFFPNGQTVVTCTAVDHCGNTNACQFTVTVRGSTNCLFVSNESALCSSNGYYTHAFDIRNDSGQTAYYLSLAEVNGNQVITQPLIPPLPSGQTRHITQTLTGVSCAQLCYYIALHNQTLAECCSQLRCVTVVDTAPPVITCATNKTVACGTNWVFDPPTAYDACCGSNVTIIVLTTVTNGTCPMTATRTWQATDCCSNSVTCAQTVTVTAGGQGDLFVEDTPYDYGGAPDFGRELLGMGDPNMIGRNMWLSRGIWVRQNCNPPVGTYLSHQNPRFGQQNCVFVNVQNRGTAPLAGAAQLEVWYANASISLAWPSSWTLLGTYPLPTINAGASHIAQLPWFPAGTGHYCLLGRIVSAADPMAVPETANIPANVRANNNLAWRNVNVEELLRTPARKVEVRARNRAGGPARSPKPITFVITADQGFLQTGGEAVLDLGPLLARWLASGAHGTNVAVTNGTQLRCTGSPARIEDIPFNDDEERIFNLTLRANEPMPVAGTNHVYHVEVMQEVDGQVVGGVSYAVVARALDTDTDGDGIKDVQDNDDDGDGVPDGLDSSPLGELDCEPSALTFAPDGKNIVLTWGGLGYRLQSTPALGQAWTDVVGGASPAVLSPSAGQRFYRLLCP